MENRLASSSTIVDAEVEALDGLILPSQLPGNSTRQAMNRQPFLRCHFAKRLDMPPRNYQGVSLRYGIEIAYGKARPIFSDEALGRHIAEWTVLAHALKE